MFTDLRRVRANSPRKCYCISNYTVHFLSNALVAGADETNLYCVQCHTVGFDAKVSYGDTVVTDPGPDLSGFDDYWPPMNAEDSSRVEALKNVQCESCHEPMGPTIYDYTPIVNFYTGMNDDPEPSICSKCHEQVEEWQGSGHGMVLQTHGMTIEEFSDEWDGSCADCHTGEGFAAANDGYWVAQPEPDILHLIGCQACHDPHDATNDHQLRNLDDYSVVYDSMYAATFTDYGTAQICVQCHHARRNNSNVAGQITNGYAYFDPQGSPQMDMFLGTGCYEIVEPAGYGIDPGARLHAHQTMAPVNPASANEACVTCHMEIHPHDDPLGWKGGHDFEAT